MYNYPAVLYTVFLREAERHGPSDFLSWGNSSSRLTLREGVVGAGLAEIPVGEPSANIPVSWLA